MSLFAEFPNELLDYIISFIVDDRTSLKNLSLVCRSWLPASRRHLFYSIKLYHSRNATLRGIEWNTDDFLHLFESGMQNTIVPFIRDATVDVWGHFLYDLFDALARAGVSLTRLETFISCENRQDDFDALGRLAAQQQDVRELKVTYDGTFRHSRDSFVPALHLCSFFPCIKTLVFGMPTSWNIKSIYDAPVTNPNRIPLENLRLSCGDNGRILGWFRENILSPGYPRTLLLDMVRYHHNGCGPVSEINNFLHHIASGLHELKISVNYVGDDVDGSMSEYTPIDLQSSRELRSFFAKMHDIRFIYDTLRSLPETSRLASCRLNIIQWRIRNQGSFPAETWKVRCGASSRDCLVCGIVAWLCRLHGTALMKNLGC